MGTKRETLEDVARQEANEEAERNAALQILRKNAERLAVEVPERFFDFARQVRFAVERFNQVGHAQKRFSWRESTALAARDGNRNADFNFAFGRVGAETTVALNVMGRSGGPDACVIEATLRLRSETHLVRIEGAVHKDQVTYRITVNFRRIDCSLEEFAEQLVIATAKADITQLTGG